MSPLSLHDALPIYDAVSERVQAIRASADRLQCWTCVLFNYKLRYKLRTVTPKLTEILDSVTLYKNCSPLRLSFHATLRFQRQNHPLPYLCYSNGIGSCCRRNPPRVRDRSIHFLSSETARPSSDSQIFGHE